MKHLEGLAVGKTVKVSFEDSEDLCGIVVDFDEAAFKAMNKGSKQGYLTVYVLVYLPNQTWAHTAIGSDQITSVGESLSPNAVSS